MGSSKLSYTLENSVLRVTTFFTHTHLFRVFNFCILALQYTSGIIIDLTKISRIREIC